MTYTNVYAIILKIYSFYHKIGYESLGKHAFATGQLTRYSLH